MQLNLSSLRTVLKKPLRPAWITPETDPSDCRLSDATSEFYPVVCCTASRRTSDSESSGTYIQGAGDDSESWSHGLTSTVFWRHHHELLNAEEGELPGLIQTFMNSENDGFTIEDLVLITPMKNMYIGNLAAVMQARDFDVVIVCTEVMPDIVEAGKEKLKGKILDLKCGSGKLGSRALRAKLPDVPAFVMALTSGLKCPKILFACSTGNDLAVGVALVVLCLFIDDNCRFFSQVKMDLLSWRFGQELIFIHKLIILLGTFNSSSSLSMKDRIDKSLVRRRLAWITSAKPDANPSRSTLQAVNSFLMERPGQ